MFVKNEEELSDVEVLKGSFRNFVGEATDYNAKGNRNFCVKLTKEQADKLSGLGWPVNIKQSNDPDKDDLLFLKIKIKYGSFKDPKIMLLTKTSKTMLDESNIDILQNSEIIRCDLVVRPYNWEVQKKSGVSAYLDSMYVTIAEDSFASKYNNYDPNDDIQSDVLPY